MKRKAGIVLLLLLGAVLLLAGCSSSPVTQRDTARLEELGKEFINDVTGLVLPNRDEALFLARQGVVVVAPGQTYNLNEVESFHKGILAGEDRSVTIITDGSAYVVSRLAFEEGQGYYFRHEYNKNYQPGDEIEVTGQFIDRVELEESRETDSLKVALYQGEAKIAILTLAGMEENTNTSQETAMAA